MPVGLIWKKKWKRLIRTDATANCWNISKKWLLWAKSVDEPDLFIPCQWKKIILLENIEQWLPVGFTSEFAQCCKFYFDCFLHWLNSLWAPYYKMLCTSEIKRILPFQQYAACVHLQHVCKIQHICMKWNCVKDLTGIF